MWVSDQILLVFWIQGVLSSENTLLNVRLYQQTPPRLQKLQLLTHSRLAISCLGLGRLLGRMLARNLTRHRHHHHVLLVNQAALVCSWIGWQIKHFGTEMRRRAHYVNGLVQFHWVAQAVILVLIVHAHFRRVRMLGLHTTFLVNGNLLYNYVTTVLGSQDTVTVLITHTWSDTMRQTNILKNGILVFSCIKSSTTL